MTKPARPFQYPQFRGRAGKFVKNEPWEGLWCALARISIISLSWTLVAGSCAIALGVAGDSLTLIAFGAIGLLDALGSATLVVHFRHALRHEAISERHERVALRVVTLGMAAVGLGTFADSIVRVVTHGVARSSAAGVALAAVSVVVLGALAEMNIAPGSAQRQALTGGFSCGCWSAWPFSVWPHGGRGGGGSTRGRPWSSPAEPSHSAPALPPLNRDDPIPARCPGHNCGMPATAYTHEPHPHLEQRHRQGPVKTVDLVRLHHPNPVVRFNACGACASRSWWERCGRPTCSD